MLRSGFVLATSRLAPNRRLFCQNLEEKCYVIKTKDRKRKVVTDSEIMKRFQENQLNQQNHVGLTRDFWKNFTEKLKYGQREAFFLFKKYKVDEKLEKQSVNLKTLFSVMQKKLEMEKIKQALTALTNVLTLELFVKFLVIPRLLFVRSKTYSRIVFHQVRHYFKVFVESKAREELQKVIVWSWINGKYLIFRVLRFIREAYFEKSDTKGIQSKKQL